MHGFTYKKDTGLHLLVQRPRHQGASSEMPYYSLQIDKEALASLDALAFPERKEEVRICMAI